MAYSKEVLDLNPQLRGVIDTATETPSKYHNCRAEAKGMTFQSGHEAAGVTSLILADEHHQGVFALRLQVRFPLPGKAVYVADAVYADDALQVHVVDFKGFKTPEYRLKKKLFKEAYGKDIEEL